MKLFIKKEWCPLIPSFDFKGYCQSFSQRYGAGSMCWEVLSAFTTPNNIQHQWRCYSQFSFHRLNGSGGHLELGWFQIQCVVDDTNPINTFESFIKICSWVHTKFCLEKTQTLPPLSHIFADWALPAHFKPNSLYMREKTYIWLHVLNNKTVAKQVVC